MIELFIISALFAGYVVYRLAEKKDEKGSVTQKSIDITPKAVFAVAKEVAGKTSGAIVGGGKLAIESAALANSAGQASYVAGGLDKISVINEFNVTRDNVYNSGKEFFTAEKKPARKPVNFGTGK